MSTNNEWKSKFQEIFNVCQEELKKTTDIGKKMLMASKSNSKLHEAYEKLGHLAFEAMASGELDWNKEQVTKLVKKIEKYTKELESIEKDVNDLKNGPTD